MAIAVLIEPLAGDGFRATSGPPLALSVEAPTRDQAVAKLREQLGQRLREGAELLSVEIAPPTGGNPWVEFAGMFRGDPWIDDWKRSVADYRREKDAEPDPS